MSQSNLQENLFSEFLKSCPIDLQEEILKRIHASDKAIFFLKSLTDRIFHGYRFNDIHGESNAARMQKEVYTLSKTINFILDQLKPNIERYQEDKQTNSSPIIVLIDDDAETCKSWISAFQQKNRTCFTYCSFEEFKNEYQKFNSDVPIFIDWYLAQDGNDNTDLHIKWLLEQNFKKITVTTAGVLIPEISEAQEWMRKIPIMKKDPPC